MNHYAVTVTSDHGNMRCLADVGEGLVKTLRRLGDDTPPLLWGAYDKERTNIVLGWNVLSTHGTRPPMGSILYNLEPLRPDNTNIPQADFWLGSDTYQVWDYSLRNQEWYRAFGLSPAYLPIGWSGSSYASAGETHVDVCFTGYMNQRRDNVRNAIVKRGMTFQHIRGVYGEERDRAARAKVCLNMHWFGTGPYVFEEVRVSHLLSNARCVVSESGDDIGEAPYLGGVLFSDVDRLAELCKLACEHSSLREQTRAEGLRIMLSRPWERFLAPLVSVL